MTNLNTALNNARSALQAQQAAIGTVSQNIANIETEGYSRKLSQFKNNSYGSLLGGVSYAEVRRTVTRELTLSYHEETANLSRALELDNAYTRLMDTLGRPDLELSLDARISEVSERFQNLLLNSSEPSNRSEAVNSAILLADEIRKVTQDMQGLRMEADQYIDSGIKRANDLISNVNDINKQLAVTDKSQAGHSELLDRRDETIKELNEIAGVYFFENPNTQAANLYLKTGQLLLNTPTAVNFLFDASSSLITNDAYEFGAGSENNKPNGILIGRNRSEALESTHLVTAGSLSGFLEIRDEIIPTYQTRVNDLAEAIYTEVNRAHNLGASTELTSHIEGQFKLAGELRNTDGLNTLNDTQIPFARGSFEVVTVNKTTGDVEDLIQINLDALANWKAENFPQPPGNARLETTQTNLTTNSPLFTPPSTGVVSFTVTDPNATPPNTVTSEIQIDFDDASWAGLVPTVDDLTRVLNGDFDIPLAGGGTQDVSASITQTPAAAGQPAGEYGGAGLAKVEIALVNGQLVLTSRDASLDVSSNFTPVGAGTIDITFANSTAAQNVAEGGQFLTVGDIIDAINGDGDAAEYGIVYSTLEDGETLGITASLSVDGRLNLITDTPSLSVMVNNSPAANPASILRSEEDNLTLTSSLGTAGDTSFQDPIVDGVNPNLLSFEIVDRDDQSLISEITFNLQEIEDAVRGLAGTVTELTLDDLVSMINGTTSLTRDGNNVDVGASIEQYPSDSGNAAGAFGGPGLAGAIASIENGELRLTGQSNEYIVRPKMANGVPQVPENIAVTFLDPPIAHDVYISQGSNTTYVKANFFDSNGVPITDVTEQSYIEPDFNTNETLSIAVRDKESGVVVSRVTVNLEALNTTVEASGDVLRYHHVVDALNGHYTQAGIITTQFPDLTGLSAGYEGGPGLFRARASFEDGSFIIRSESDRYGIETEANGLAVNRPAHATDVGPISPLMLFTEAYEQTSAGEHSPNDPRNGSLSYFFGLNDLFVTPNRQGSRLSVAETINVREDIIADPNRISHGVLRREDVGQPPISEFSILSGDGQTAERIVEALSQPVWIGGSRARSTIQYAGDIINQISFAATAQQNELIYREDLHRSIKEQISEVRGVNLDEELQDLIVFQRAYSASARVMSSVQDMLDEIINMVR